MESVFKAFFRPSMRCNAGIIRRELRFGCCRRAMGTTRCLRAVKAPRPPLKKLLNKPSEYKSPLPKAPFTQKPAPKKPTRGRFHPIALIIGGASLFFFASGTAYFVISIVRAKDMPFITPAAQADVSSQYDKIARSFDASIDSTEYWMGISSLRKKLASLAHGDVLEVSIGTGRNLEFYDWNFKGFNGVGKPDGRGYMKKGKIRSFTAVDKSSEMLEIAHEKFGKLFPGILGVRWIIADASQKGAVPGPPRSSDERSGNLEQKYDTVIQTMGLCSVSNPVGLLRNLGECVKEDEGRILLLEHGRGRWQWLNRMLDQSAEGHAKQFGCWWNRDLKGIVEESGLEVVKIETPKWWHGGTTWWMELKKPRVKLEEKPPTAMRGPNVELDEKPKKKGWW